MSIVLIYSNLNTNKLQKYLRNIFYLIAINRYYNTKIYA